MNHSAKPYEKHERWALAAVVFTLVVGPSATMVLGSIVGPHLIFWHPEKMNAGVDPSSLTRADVVGYQYGGPEKSDEAYRCSSKRDLERESEYFNDLPTRPFLGSERDLIGSSATDVVFTMDDGSTQKFTQVHLGYRDLVVVWPDGTASRTAVGLPFSQSYAEDFCQTLKVDDTTLRSEPIPIKKSRFYYAIPTNWVKIWPATEAP